MLTELIELPASHLLGLRQRLESAGLPFDDVGEPGKRFCQLEVAGTPVGWAGLEPSGADALLRSVFVLDQMRGRHHGRLLGSASAAEAGTLGAERLWLLTTTATGFFTNPGFHTVPRNPAPQALQESGEFASLCPASAICMMLDLSQAQESR